MNLAKIKEVAKEYLAALFDDCTAEKYDGDVVVEISDQVELASVESHLSWMLQQMQDMNDHDKLNRWLGFVQGVLWVLGYRTINEMREENKE